MMTSEEGRRPPRARSATSGSANQGKPGRRKGASPAAPGAHAAPTSAAPTATAGTNGRGSGNHTADHDLRVVAAAAPPAARNHHPAHSSLIQDDPLNALLAEAQAAVSDGANALRDVRERYRAAYNERVERLEVMRGWPTAGVNGRLGGAQAADQQGKRDSTATVTGQEVGQERSILDRIDLAAKSLENAWLFLAREDTSLVNDPSGPPSAADAQMRIVEAQEQERTRLAREVHDGPAQALSNAIFQVEVVQRLLDRDEQAAREELKQLREVLTRELRGVRAYLSQLRPPLLADLGLSGAIREAASQTETALNVPVTVEVADEIDNLPETVEVVALRVIQEALQNARKHAQPTSIRVRMAKDGHAWAVEVRDDGKGFDADDPPVSGRRHFGLQFMRERAELIGARFEVRSSPNLGTAVRMTIPPGAMGMPIPEGEVS